MKKNWAQDSSTPSTNSAKWSTDRIWIVNTTAHSITQMSPEEMVKLSVTHRQYSPATASTTLNHTVLGTRFFKNTPKMGTNTI